MQLSSFHCSQLRQVREMKTFASVVRAIPDSILGVDVAFRQDTDPRKVNLGVGAYRSDDGVPYVFQAVKAASKTIMEDVEAGRVFMEYLQIDGLADLKPLTQKLLFGDTAKSIAEGRVASVQSISGTGALRVAAEFIREFLIDGQREVYVSTPTWANHRGIFNGNGLVLKDYPYWDANTCGLNIEGMLSTMKVMPEGAVIVLHAVAHNPTGMDPTEKEWEKILEVVKERKLLPIMDVAYQGFASGDLERDAFAVRLFERNGVEMFVCQSFAKNMGLYGQRIGMLHTICRNTEQAGNVLSQLKIVIRRMYSSPPLHGALILHRVLKDAQLTAQWKVELNELASRLLDVRRKLREMLEKKGTPGTWEHITRQQGMFSYTGLKPEEVERLTEKWHIYLLKSGRISLAGLNSKNLQYFVDAVDEVVRYHRGGSKASHL